MSSKALKKQIESQVLHRGPDGRFLSKQKTEISKKFPSGVLIVKDNKKKYHKDKLKKVLATLIPEEIKLIEKEKKIPCHSTMSEIIFLKNLGTGQYSTCDTERVVLLKNYIKAAKRRVNWKGLDKDAVMKFAKEKLSEEKAFLKKRGN